MFVKDIRKDFYDLLIGKRILVLVNYDIDALCATKLLTNLFQVDNILYTIFPILDAEDLLQVYNHHRNNVKYVLLLNLGATFDVIDFLEPEEEQVFFIADNHRPIDVYNIYRGDQLRLLMKSEDNEEVPSYHELFCESDDDEDEDNNEEESEKRSTLEELEKRKEKRIWIEKRRKILFEYNQFSFFGESITWTFFKLSWKMSKDSIELLWLAIVGIFDMYVTKKIDLSKLESYCDSLKSHLKRLNHLKNDVNLFNTDSNSVDEILNVPLGKRSCITITQQKDLQLMLYRHWSLFESLRHTMVVSCKFKVWNIKGHKKLLEFLAELGIPLTQCKQNFSSMDFELKKNVLQWIDDLSEKYNLDNIIGEAFIVSYGYKHRLSANDVAHGLRALLESPAKESIMKEKFMKALDACSWSNTSLLLEGIDLAKIQMIAILKQVHDIIDMKTIVSSGPFLHVIISESTPDAKLFCFPGCLLILARFLLSAYVASSKKRRVVNLPLVIITPDFSSPGYGLAAGIPPIAEQSPRNLFGKAFIQSGQIMNCQMEPSLYDLSVVKFPYNERSNLLEALISLLS